MNKIILISGSSYGAGKDTLAEMIATECENRCIRGLIMRFGDWVKDALMHYYEWNGIKNEAGRHLLQTFATDKVRAYDETYWAEVTYRLAAAIQQDWDLLLVPDLRFPNEYLTGTKFFNPRDITTVRVDRNFNTDKSANRNHISEHAMEKFSYDYIIDNSGTIEELNNKGIKLLDKIIEI